MIGKSEEPRTASLPKPEMDPITLEVVRHTLRAITDELETNLTRTAFSPLIYEYKDYAVGIVAADGQLIAQGPGGLPIFLADIGGPLRFVLEDHPPETLQPGDAIITNDPEACGQHLNNVNMYTPVFAQGELVAFAAVRTHWTDLGGMVLGSCLGNDSTEIFQEGINFPSLKICKAGRMDTDILRLIRKNTRFPDMVEGDLQAQLAACRLGERRLLELMGRYGWETVRKVIHHTWDQAERLARQRIMELPDGVYEAESWLDNDGIDLDSPIPIKVKVIVAGDSITVDMTDIADQVKGPFNSCYFGGGLTAAKVAFKYGIIPDLPPVEGCFRPLNLILPMGKMLSADPTAAMGRWNVPMSTVIDTILKAISGAAPANVPAAHHAAQNSFQFIGRRANGQRWQHHDTAHGGWGAWPHGDGTGPFKTMSHGDCKDIPVEIVEAFYPVRVERYGFVQDSGGAGRFRGGPGMDRTYQTLAPCALTVNFERTQCPPWGLQGGGAGKVGSVLVKASPEADPVVLTKASAYPLPAGAVVTLRTSGGGGYGDPRTRDPLTVAEDVRLGFVSAAEARETYAVVVDADTCTVDDQATQSLRGSMNKQKVGMA